MSLLNRKKIYDTVYSLGANCSAASYLNDHFLRVTSGPFDWWGMPNAGKENFAQRIRLISTRFAGFLKKENLELTHVEGGDSQDPYFDPYWDHGEVDIFLPHDFPIGEPMEQNYDKVKAKYDRRIARFYEKIQQSERVLLVWVAINDAGCEPDTIKSLCDSACREFGKTVDFLLIWQDDSMARTQPAVKQQLTPNITLWRVNFYHAPEGETVGFMGCKEQLNPIFEEYQLEGMQWAPLKTRLYAFFGRLLCSLIPVRTWRKRARRVFIDNQFNRDYHRELRNRP